MSRSILIPGNMPVIDEVRKHIIADDQHYSRNLILFPGKRPAHFLRRTIGETVGKSFIPPEILSFDAFVDQVYNVNGGSQRAISPADASVILFGIHSTLEERIGGTEFDTFDRFLPIGLRMFEGVPEYGELVKCSLEHGCKGRLL